MSKTIILNTIAIQNKIRRIAYQIYEINSDEEAISIAGIKENGFLFAQKVAAELEKISPISIQIGSISVDKKNPLSPISTSLQAVDYRNKPLVIIDDVLHTGSTLMYAVRHFLAEPLTRVNTVVLVDRNHKQFPIKVDFKGISLSTSLQDHVEVVFNKEGDYVYLE